MSTAQVSGFARLLAWLAVAGAILFVVAGLAKYGLSAETHQRFWSDIVDRSRGPMTFRYFLQPTMAALAALWDGIADARAGRPPYFWSLLAGTSGRVVSLNEALVSTARIILLGLGMDMIYQLRVFEKFYPGEAVVFTLLLAFIPYLLLRGPISRVAAWWLSSKKEGTRA